MIFPQKFLFWENGPFWTQKWLILITLDRLQQFFSNRYMNIVLMAFPKRNLVWGKWTMWDPRWHVLTTVDLL